MWDANATLAKRQHAEAQLGLERSGKKALQRERPGDLRLGGRSSPGLEAGHRTRGRSTGPVQGGEAVDGGSPHPNEIRTVNGFRPSSSHEGDKVVSAVQGQITLALRRSSARRDGWFDGWFSAKSLTGSRPKAWRKTSDRGLSITRRDGSTGDCWVAYKHRLGQNAVCARMLTPGLAGCLQMIPRINPMTD